MTAGEFDARRVGNAGRGLTSGQRPGRLLELPSPKRPRATRKEIRAKQLICLDSGSEKQQRTAQHGRKANNFSDLPVR
jgi:hypothetical protein